MRGREMEAPDRLTAAGNSKALILVVDDESSIRSVMARILRAEGYDVVTEVDGVGALDSVRLLRPDVVLLDLMMPGMDGFEVCRRLRADPETRLTPVLLLTGLSAVHDRVRGLDAGADDFLSKPPETPELLARVRSLVRLRRHTDQLVRAESVVLSLARSIEGKDPCTEGHCERLSEYGTALGRRIGLPEEELDALRTGGILHDIGKVGVPDAILLKEGKLTPDEWEVMKRHTLTGEHICGPVHSFGRVLPIIRHHHEKYDGSGYPDGLMGEEIPVTARVLQIVDVYDALISERPYKAALSARDGMLGLKGEVEQGWWDREVYEAFEGMITEERSHRVEEEPIAEADGRGARQ